MIEYLVTSIQTYRNQGFQMYPIFIVIVVGGIIQLTKVVIDTIKYKQFYRGYILLSGGFPSFHAGMSSCVIVLALLEYGFDSVIFAATFIFGLLFIYDAMNLRYEAGQHAQYINALRTELQDVLHKKEHSKLKERIGHTPWEVAGGILFGLVFTYVFYYLFYLR